MKPDWTPVLNGDRYCSPACGSGCTRQQHDAAQVLAEETAQALGGAFEAHVWENLGWHASARTPHCGVHPPRRGGSSHRGQYQAYGAGQVGMGDTPVAAVRALKDVLVTRADRYLHVAAAIEVDP